MAERTGISWCDHTFNIAWGCVKISEGCKFCYADTLSGRFGLDVWGPGKARKTMGAKYWNDPIRWNRSAEKAGARRRVFTSSMTDVFMDDTTIDAERDRLWGLIRTTPALDWLILTKRADRIAAKLPADWGEGYPNAWLGVSIEDAGNAWRADELRKLPAVVRFVSYEPALGPLDSMPLDGLDWVIYGGESGNDRRADDRDWARSMRDRCREAGVAFFYKQESARKAGTNPYLDGEEIKEWPTPRCVDEVKMGS
jgi:protein gp37